jgi:SAM-dependent MidA family methyltransferase
LASRSPKATNINSHTPYDPNAPLAERLRSQIRRDGTMSFRDWMQAALYDEREGYYRRSDRKRWGRAGDYRTAPERSPLFAATFARYFANLFGELGAPAKWTIIEAGAGSGEFAWGVLNGLRAQYPQVFAATTYLIDEISSETREQVRQKVSQFSKQVEFRQLNAIEKPVGAGIIFSNELLDALPAHRVIVRGERPQELRVGLDDAGGFAWVECELTDAGVRNYLARCGVQLSDGQIVEVNLKAEEWIVRAASALAEGFVISVDYGAERGELLGAPHRHAGSLRAFHRHQIVDDVLARPGEQDLTTTVDWTQIREAGERAGLEVVRLQGLDQFLVQEGLLDELAALAGETQDVEAMRLRTSAREMVMPYGMASSFQVLVQRRCSIR